MSDRVTERDQSFLKRAWRFWVNKTGVDWKTYTQICKGATAPLICVACYQATPWAEYFTTQGYLVAIAAITATVTLPRAKFVQTMVLTLIFTCFAAALTMLALYCCVEARQNTESQPGRGPNSGLAGGHVQTVAYNSSASVVAAIWLIAQIFVASAVRALKPQLTIPCIVWVLFADVGMVYAPQIATIVDAKSFLQRLLSAMLAGFGIGSGVSILIFPATCRSGIFKKLVAYASAAQAVLESNRDYLSALPERHQAFFRRNDAPDICELSNSIEVQNIEQKVKMLTTIHAKLVADLPFAKREAAIGKLGSDDIQNIFRLLRLVMVPLTGFGQLSKILRRLFEVQSNNGGNYTVDTSSSNPEMVQEDFQERMSQQHQDLMRAVIDPFSRMSLIAKHGIEHALVVLELKPSPPENQDFEKAAGEEPRPGSKDFASFLSRKTDEFLENKHTILRKWCQIHGVKIADDFFNHPTTAEFQGELPAWMNEDFFSSERVRNRRQLYVVLYLEVLLATTTMRVLDLVLFAEELRAAGRLKSSRLIVPAFQSLKTSLDTMLRNIEDSHIDGHTDSEHNVIEVYMGDALKKKRDPVHRPPVSWWERSSDKLRIVPRFFASPAALFALRVCCATMSIGVVAYLRQTQVVFTEERFLWSIFVVSFSMQPTAGTSLRNFLFRVIATVVFMLLAWIAWYIVDGQTAGVLVFYWLFLHFPNYLLLKHPEWLTISLVGQITLTDIVAYELQVRKIGLAAATSSGVPYHPAYLLGVIRLATYSGGLLLAWIWTIFPYPVSEHSQLREMLSSCLYLLANYYSIMVETVRIRLKGDELDKSPQQTAGLRLEKARDSVFAKCTMLQNNLKAQMNFIKYDIPIGGKFPREEYAEMIATTSSFLNNMQLVTFASSAFTEILLRDKSHSSSQWLQNFRQLISEAGVTSQAVTSLLTLLSNSMHTSSPLPPFISVPEPYLMAKRLDELDHDVLSVRHIAEPGYASFSVIEIATVLIIEDLETLLAGTKELVGEFDFSYHIISSTNQEDVSPRSES